MRATIGDVLRRPSSLPDWWFELPWRRHPIRALRTILFEPGKGWLRWGSGTFWWTDIIDPYIGGPSYEETCYPPLRRAWFWLKSRFEWVLRGGGWIRNEPDHPRPTWDRLTWREFVPTRADLQHLRDPEWPWGYL